MKKDIFDNNVLIITNPYPSDKMIVTIGKPRSVNPNERSKFKSNHKKRKK